MDDPNFAAAFANAEASSLIEPICGARLNQLNIDLATRPK